MRISDLEEFVILGETLSFTQTAQRLYTTQSSVSKHLAALEREMGVQLFVRNQQGVHLTRAGRGFLTQAERILSDYEEALAVVSRLKSGQDGSLRIGYLACADVCNMMLPQAINEFQDRYPNVDLRFSALEMDEIIDQLDDKRIDMGITTDFAKFSPTRFSILPLYKDFVRVIVPKGHRLASRASVSVMDLVGEQIILSDPAYMTRSAPTINKLIAPIVDKVVIKEIAIDVLSQLMLLRTGRYISIFFDHVKHFNNFNQEFSFIPLDECKEEFQIIAVWKTSAETSAVLDMAHLLKLKVAENPSYLL